MAKQKFDRSKPHVNNRANDLYYFPNVIAHEEVLLSFLISNPMHDYWRALAPLTISVSSFVIPA